ncbi:MAG TPA: RsmE family RNA methyltransferase [Clostridia bacterium]|nr:RsmE family RNA methyltransferase [Clostridia bacterium]
MHRFYLPPEQCGQTVLTLTGAEAHHAVRVLRLVRGDAVTVLNGAGGEFRCRVQEALREVVMLDVLEKHVLPAPPAAITLIQALPKGKIMESIIEKATELGASRVVPLLAERVVSRLDAREAAHKAEKWQATAVAAIKQSGSAWLPRIEVPVTPKEFVSRQERFELPLIASLGPGTRHAADYFDGFRARHQRQPGTVGIWVGPEGDFTPEELDLAQAAGAQPITLGPLVLRVETAATYCLSILNHELRR